MIRSTPAWRCVLALGWVLTLSACSTRTNAPPATSRTVLTVHSYHQGYRWTDAEGAGIRAALAGSGVRIGTDYMDTKRHADAASKTAAGEHAQDADALAVLVYHTVRQDADAIDSMDPTTVISWTLAS